MKIFFVYKKFMWFVWGNRLNDVISLHRVYLIHMPVTVLILLRNQLTKSLCEEWLTTPSVVLTQKEYIFYKRTIIIKISTLQRYHFISDWHWVLPTQKCINWWYTQWYSGWHHHIQSWWDSDQSWLNYGWQFYFKFIYFACHRCFCV